MTTNDEYYVMWYGNHLSIVKLSGRWRDQTTLEIIKRPSRISDQAFLAIAYAAKERYERAKEVTQ